MYSGLKSLNLTSRNHEKSKERSSKLGREQKLKICFRNMIQVKVERHI